MNMIRNTRRLAGARSKLFGEEFENMLRHPARRIGAVLVRMPDGCKMVRRGGSLITQRVKTPLDFILTRRDLGVAFFDAKSSGDNAFSYSSLTEHQVTALAELKAAGNAAGYLVYYRQIDLAVWYDVALLQALRPRQSLKPEDGVNLGGLLSLQLDRIFPHAPAEIHL